jgi:hypothetical protein
MSGSREPEAPKSRKAIAFVLFWLVSLLLALTLAITTRQRQQERDREERQRLEMQGVQAPK